MVATVFIDGEAGTTGLQIRRRLEARSDVKLLHLDDASRKDAGARAAMLNRADVSILCLPEDASRQAAAMIDNPDARVIDASIAYRTDPDWVFGFPEMVPGQADKIAAAKRVSNPGCYALSSISMLFPLISAGVLPADFPATINAISGYSGGGKKLIADFEDPAVETYTESTFYHYALGLEHKHTEEIRVHGGLTHRPLFVPSVGRYAQGMIVSLPLQLWSLPGKPNAGDIHEVLAAHYAGQRFVSVAPMSDAAAANKLDPEALNGTNELRLQVFGNDGHEQAVVTALLDNLGKGASGQAMQNMNLMLGFDEGEGL
jgi:N-acetyl-gamma-glutamyl-phosphate reductase